MSCGSGRNGCLGHGNIENCTTPRLVENLLHLQITQVELLSILVPIWCSSPVNFNVGLILFSDNRVTHFEFFKSPSYKLNIVNVFARIFEYRVLIEYALINFRAGYLSFMKLTNLGLYNV